MDAILEKQSTDLLYKNSCHLDNYYKNYNDSLFKKSFNNPSKDMHLNIGSLNVENINYLNSHFIHKKSCIFTSTEPNNDNSWVSQFSTIHPNVYQLFDYQTRIKTNNHNNYYNCP
jgi:hypothetical protein